MGRDHPLCSMHYKRRQRGQCMNAPERIVEVMTPRERLLSDAIRYADADPEDDGDYARRETRVIASAMALAKKEPMLDGQALIREHMRQLGRMGGKARAASLNPAVRVMIARRGSDARWKK